MRTETKKPGISSRGLQFNTGNGNTLQPLDIGHDNYLGLVDPDTAFWALVQKDKLGEALTPGPFLEQYREKAASFAEEMEKFRFSVTPSAVYFNPTERCNLNCTYCYLPETMRQDGRHMPVDQVLSSLEILKKYFAATLPEGFKPQIVFHGAEPTLNWEGLLAAFEHYGNDFRFGIQTNGTVLDDAQYDVLMKHGIAVGLSLDSALDEIVTRTRKTWDGHSIYAKVIAAMEKLRGYPNYSVICTVTRENMHNLIPTVEFFHEQGVSTCMLNPVRCTRQGARDIKPADEDISRYYLAALDRTEELFRQTGRRMVVANFANILIAILAPQARRLMCDISPCGGGRSFFALAANGDCLPLQRVHRAAGFQRRQPVPRPDSRHPRDFAVQAGHGPQGRGHRSLLPLRCTSLLRLALPGRSLRDEWWDGPARRVLRAVRRSGPLCDEAHRRRSPRLFPVGGLGPRHDHDLSDGGDVGGVSDYRRRSKLCEAFPRTRWKSCGFGGC